jgi:hypothetical protein
MKQHVPKRCNNLIAVMIGGLLQGGSLWGCSLLSWLSCVLITSVSAFYYVTIGERGAGSSKPKLVKSSSMKDLSNGGNCKDEPKAGKSD